MNELCKDGRHKLKVEYHKEIRCELCPLVVPASRIALLRSQRELNVLIREIEREWYIKELES
jgi:hypothetical protein